MCVWQEYGDAKIFLLAFLVQTKFKYLVLELV